MPSTTPIVLVTEPEYRKGEDRFLAASGLHCRRTPDDEDELADAVRHSQVKYVIVGNRQYTGPLYDALPPGGVIARYGVGHDGVDKSRATARRLLCTNTPGVLDQSVAVTAAGTLIAYAVYALDGQTAASHPAMILTIPIVAYGVFRYLYLLYRRGRGGIPEAMIFTDRGLLAAVVLWALCSTAALYISR